MSQHGTIGTMASISMSHHLEVIGDRILGLGLSTTLAITCRGLYEVINALCGSSSSTEGSWGKGPSVSLPPRPPWHRPWFRAWSFSFLPAISFLNLPSWVVTIFLGFPVRTTEKATGSARSTG